MANQNYDVTDISRRFHSIENGVNIVANADEIQDVTLDKKQDAINQEVSDRLDSAEDLLENNAPYTILYENQTVNIPCDPYGNYIGSEDEIGTLVRLYRGNIVQEIAVGGINIIEPSNPIFNTYVNDENEDKSAFIFVSNSNVSNLSDNVEVNFSITDTNNNIYYGKVIFNKVKQGKSAFEEWKDANPSIENPTINRFLAELKNTNSINGPKYAPDIASATEDLTIYFIPNSDTTKFDIWFREDSNTITRLAKEIPGDITNYVGIYDVSADHNNIPYTTLDLAVAAIPNTAKKGGMTIKFIQRTGADAKYVQYRYLLASTAAADFNDKDNWVKDSGGSGIIEGYEEIFAKPNVTAGGLNKSDGSVSDSTWCHNEEYIQVSNGNVIIWKAGTALSDASQLDKNALIYYNASFQKINYFVYNLQNRELTISDANVAYIRASFPYEDGYGIDINRTSVFTVDTKGGTINQLPTLMQNVENLAEEISDVRDELTVGTNVEVGGLRYKDGVITNYNDLCHNDDNNYIEVNVGDEVQWFAGTPVSDITKRDSTTLIIYNEDKEYIGYWTYNQENRQITINPPSSGTHAGETPKYIRASFPYEDGHGIEINGKMVFTVVVTPYSKLEALAEEVQDAKSTAEDVAEQFDSITDKLKELSEFYSEVGYYLDKEGNKVRDDGWAISLPIACALNDTMIMTTPSDMTSQSYDKHYCGAFDNNGNFITYYQQYPRTKQFTDNTLSDLAYIQMSVRLSDAEQFSVKINNELKYKGKDINGNLYLAIKEAIASGNTSGNDVNVPNNVSYMPLKGFVQKDLGTNFTTTDSTKAVCTSVMQIPYLGVRFNVKIPEDVSCKIQYGNMTSGSTASQIEEINASGVTIQYSNYEDIRFAFLKKDGSDVTPSDIQALVDSGEISISYENKTPNVVVKNIACESYTKAVMSKYIYQTSNHYTTFKTIPVFAHFSDLHGDVVRLKNIMDYCQYLGVDAIINSGDTVRNRSINGLDTYHAIVGSYDIPTLLCVGNHDAWVDGDSLSGTPNEKVYAECIEPNSTKFGYTLPVAADYDGAPTYYYRDFTALQIRVISVNLYEENRRRWDIYGRISKKQIDWLISTLASTPTGYGVIIINHINTNFITKPGNPPEYNTEFYDVARPSNLQGNIEPNLSGDPIGKIVDAFISRNTCEGSYSQLLTESGSETIQYSADFTNINENVEFICYMNGHHHADFVGYHQTSGYQYGTKQLELNITTAQSLYGPSRANDGDLTRGGQGACEDAFNVYGIDREAGTVKIARVGANMTSSLTKREFMVIPYRD